MKMRNFFICGWLFFFCVFSSCAQTNGGYKSKMKIIIGNTTLTATLAENSSVRALEDLLDKGDITLNMNDFSNFEKVADLGTSLPRNDEQITTGAGDLILYLGRNFVIYYDTNSWNFTRLGKIDGVSQSELKRLLGTGDVTVILSK